MVASAACLLIAAGGCSRIRTHQGFIADPLISDSVKAGIDNRESVEGALGHPTFISQFGPERWYYVSRNTKQLAFGSPKATDQLILQVQFDNAGNVAQITRMGMEQVANLSPAGGKTRTLGRKRSLFDEIFGNIGAVGAGGGSMAPTGPGPNGS
jgi:outer membrane protein assembly factor BamE (lipoprotein component of BamABCDE complex)